MDHNEEQYDPDSDVSRFLGSPDCPEDLVLSPLPLLSEEVYQPMLPPLPHDVLQQVPSVLLPQEVIQQASPPLFPQEVLQQSSPLLPQELLQQALPLLPHEVLQQTAPLVPHEVLQQEPPLLLQEALQQAPLLLPQEVPQQMLTQFPQEVSQQVLQPIQGLDGTNTVPGHAVDHMQTLVTHEPLSIEGVIIAAMENIPIEGSSSSNPRNDAMYEPIFHQFAPGQRDCSDCIPLREVLHSTSNRNLIFTVHGGMGTFDHAVFDAEYLGRDGRPSTRELFYVELSTRSHNWVKSFIVGCITLLQADPSATMHDSLTSFYDTLCADMNNNTAVDEIMSMDFGSWLCFQDSPDFEFGESSNTEDDMFEDNISDFDLSLLPELTGMIPNSAQMQNPLFESSGTVTMSGAGSSSDGAGSSSGTAGSSSGTAVVIPENPQAAPVEPAADTGRRSSGPTQLALQRQRTANMRLPELADYFHLPIAEAAKQLGVCSTALKHVCRRNGLVRWPSRQIQAIDRQIERLENIIYEKNLRTGWLAIKEQIEALKIKRRAIYDKLSQDLRNKKDKGKGKGKGKGKDKDKDA